MSQTKSSIIILKPTSFFMSFVAEQLPDFDHPDEDEKPMDNIAYTMPSCENDEALLEHLERLFPYMFRHEVIRLLGEKMASNIKADFLDFLCCFKFEVHTQTVLMASSIEDCRQVVCVKPRVVSFQSFPSEKEGQIEMKGLLRTLETARTANVTTALVRHFDLLSDIKPLLQRYARPILKADVMRKAAQTIQWPTISSWQMFNRYFAVQVHTQLVHLH